MSIQKRSSRSKAKVINVGISLSVFLYSAHAFAGNTDIFQNQFSSVIEYEASISTSIAHSDYSGSDLNGDGAVTAADLLLLRNQLDEIPGDLDHDQLVTSADANILQNNLHQYNVGFDLNRDGVLNAADVQVLGSRLDAKGMGDLNHDGFVSAADSEILRTKLNTSDVDADLNKDGIVTGADLILIFNRLDNKPGDLNHDGSVTYADIKILRSNLHKADVSSDLNKDGSVNAEDFRLLRNRLNQKGDLNNDGFVSKADVEILKTDLQIVELNKDFNKYDVVDSSALEALMAESNSNDKGSLDYQQLSDSDKGFAINSHLQTANSGFRPNRGSGGSGGADSGFSTSGLKFNGNETAASGAESEQQTSGTGLDISGKSDATMSANSVSLHSNTTHGFGNTGSAGQTINNLRLLADTALAGNLNADVLQNLSSTEIEALLAGLGAGALQNLSLSEITALLASQLENDGGVSEDIINSLLNSNPDLLASIADLGLDLNGDGVVDAADLLFLQDQLVNNPDLVDGLIEVVTAQNLDGGGFQAENMFSNLPNQNGSGSDDPAGNNTGETPEPDSLWLMMLAGLLMLSSLRNSHSRGTPAP